MNDQPKPKMTPRARILVQGVRLTSGTRDNLYGDPKINMACAGELKRVFLKYAVKSPRRIGPGEHEAIDLVLTKISRIATGTVPHEDTYVDGATYMAIAGECALEGTPEARSVFGHEQTDEDFEEAAANQIESAVKEVSSS
jgi:hypothetical protein